MKIKLDIKRLRYFYTIVEQGSFRKAATTLNISQPPLSQRLKELEDALGAELIKRNTRNLSLTKEGEYVYEKVQEIINTLESIPRGVMNIKNNIHNTFHIGVSPTCLSHFSYYMPFIHLEFPETYTSVVTGDSTYLEKVLLSQKIDAALLQVPRIIDPDYEILLLTPTEAVVVLPKHYKHNSENISFEELAKIPLALLRRVTGFGIYDVLMHTFHQKNLQPIIVMDSPEIQTILNYMQLKPNVASILPVSELSPEIYNIYDIKHLDHKDFFMRPCFMYLKSNSTIPILNRFKELIQTSSSRHISL